MQLTLRAARINAGYTQQQVHNLTGFARSTLTRWENGAAMPTIGDLIILCNLYEVSVDQIKWQ